MAIGLECLQRGHHIDVFTMEWEGDVPEGMSVHLISASGLSNHQKALAFSKALHKQLDSSSYDLSMGFNQIPGLDLYFAADICYRHRIRTNRSMLSCLTPRYYVFAGIEKAIFSKESSTEIIYLSNQQKNNYQQEYDTPDGRFHYVPPGVERQKEKLFFEGGGRSEIRQELHLNPQDFFLLMVGSHFQTKGVDRAILALAALPASQIESTFLFIIGMGKQGKFKKLAHRLGVALHVQFLGGRDDVPRFYAGADLLLQPSLYESAGNTIVEALVAGVPVLATDTCGYAEHVVQANAGKVIAGEPFIQADMDHALQKMLLSLKNRKWQEQALAYARMTDLYDRKVVVVDLLEELAGKKKNQVLA